MFYAFWGLPQDLQKLAQHFFLATLYLLLSASGHSGQKQGRIYPLYKNLGAHGRFLGFIGFPKVLQKLTNFLAAQYSIFSSAGWT
jgi:hypothetical protein